MQYVCIVLVPSPFPCSSSQFLIAARPGGAFAGAVRLWAARPAAGAASGHAGGSDCAGSPAAQPAETCARQVCRFTIKLYIHGLCGYLLQCSRACGVLWYCVLKKSAVPAEMVKMQRRSTACRAACRRHTGGCRCRAAASGTGCRLRSSWWRRPRVRPPGPAAPAAPHGSRCCVAAQRTACQGTGCAARNSSCCTLPVVSRLHTHGLRYDAEQLNQLRRYVSNACVNFAR